MTAPRPLMFNRLAPFYDDLVASKDYRSEADRLEGLARRYGRSAGNAWLDVACGTGRHLEFLRRHYSVMGVDASPAMLRIARRRLPGVRLELGDMRRFQLHRSFDVLSCLYSAVGHLRTEQDLGRAFANFARHLKPGGVVVVEPWIAPADFRSGYVHLFTHRTPERTVVRLALSARRGHRSLIRYHYLIAEPRKGVQHFEEVDAGLLVSRERLVALLTRAGFSARFLARGFTPGRGLLIGVKKASPSAPPTGPLPRVDR